MRPFRGLRYDPARVSDLAAVTSPPYDVIDPDSATHLEELDPHNVVRLILPREPAPDGRRRVRRRGRGALAGGCADGVLRRDDEPALYVYEQAGEGVVQRGVLAAVALRDPADRVDAAARGRDGGSGRRPAGADAGHRRPNLEPILLVYDGGGDTAAVIDEVCAGPPVLETTAEDGLRAAGLARDRPGRCSGGWRPTWRRDRRSSPTGTTATRPTAGCRRSTGRPGTAPATGTCGLAMLVDSLSHPLRVQAIHRVVGGLDLAEALRRVEQVFRGPPAARRRPRRGARGAAADTGAYPLVVTDGHGVAVIDDPDPRVGRRRAAARRAHRRLAQPRRERPPRTRAGAACRPRRASCARRYVHDAAAAVRAAARDGGVAVLMRPVTVEAVQGLAARGERMPRKTTSFGPKPRTGLVLRPLDR